MKRSTFPSHPSAFKPTLFRGVVTHVVDGDTFDVLLNLGFGASIYVTLRLRDFDAPELRDQDPVQQAMAQAMKEYATELLLDQPVVVQTYKGVTFGRYIADVMLVASVQGFAVTTDVRPLLEQRLAQLREQRRAQLGEVIP